MASFPDSHRRSCADSFLSFLGRRRDAFEGPDGIRAHCILLRCLEELCHLRKYVVRAETRRVLDRRKPTPVPACYDCCRNSRRHMPGVQEQHSPRYPWEEARHPKDRHAASACAGVQRGSATNPGSGARSESPKRARFSFSLSLCHSQDSSFPPEHGNCVRPMTSASTPYTPIKVSTLRPKAVELCVSQTCRAQLTATFRALFTADSSLYSSSQLEAIAWLGAARRGRAEPSSSPSSPSFAVALAVASPASLTTPSADLTAALIVLTGDAERAQGGTQEKRGSSSRATQKTGQLPHAAQTTCYIVLDTPRGRQGGIPEPVPRRPWPCACWPARPGAFRRPTDPSRGRSR